MLGLGSKTETNWGKLGRTFGGWSAKRRFRPPLQGCVVLALVLLLQCTLASDVNRPTIHWRDVSLEIRGKKILRGLNGQASRGRLLALMGPSGAGKTSLLQVLAGTLAKKRGQVLRGRIGGSALEEGILGEAAFVGQNDQFHAQLSVSETLLLAAGMRLPEEGRERRIEIVESLMRMLHLAHVRSCKVGNERNRGISGGEVRRLALGCELVGSPDIIFADEPTSGLDAFQAERMMDALRSLAKGGRTVVVSIHQPSSKIWRMLDDVALLTEGRCVYFGPRSECLPGFKSMGFTCPLETNPAEFVLDVISVDQSSMESERQSTARVLRLASQWEAKRKQGGSERVPARASTWCCSGAADPEPDEATGVGDDWHGVKQSGPRARGRRMWFGAAFKMLFARNFKQNMRDVFVNSVRFAATIVLAGMFGVVWGDQASVVDRIGSVVMTSINTSMIALVKALTSYVEERPVVNRERRYYGPVSYLLSKVLSEGPLDAFFAALFGYVVHESCKMGGDAATFTLVATMQALASAALGQLIGATVPSPSAALAAGPPFMLVLTIVGAVGPSGRPKLPGLLAPLREMSMIRWGCEGLCVLELPYMIAEDEPAKKSFLSGAKHVAQEAKKKALLKGLSLDGCTVRGSLIGQLRLISCCYGATIAALVATRPQYQQLEEPMEDEAVVALQASVLPLEYPEFPLDEDDSDYSRPRRRKKQRHNSFD